MLCDIRNLAYNITPLAFAGIWVGLPQADPGFAGIFFG
jgi:hypothetical protein